MKFPKSTYIFFLAYIVAWVLLPGCTADDGDRPTVAVSIAPQKYIVEQIAGDRLEVKTLLSQGANPESYEPAMSHMLNLEKSRAYLRMGNLGFEDAIISKVRNSRPDLHIYDMSDGIPLISGTHCDHQHPDAEADHDHSHDIDPHTWSSVANVRIMASNTLSALKEIDPENSEYYTRNYRQFVNRLDSIDGSIREILDGAPRRFVVWHPSLSYFARDYGLEQISLGQDNKELSVPGLRRRIEQAGGSGKVALLLQRDFDMRQAEVVNKEIGAEIVYINPLNPDWEAEMLYTARAIALKK